MNSARQHIEQPMRQPIGQAMAETLIVIGALMLIVIAIERSPDSLVQGLIRMLEQYRFSLSIPW